MIRRVPTKLSGAMTSAVIGAIALAGLAGPAARAQTDEIQVYDATINEPGQMASRTASNSASAMASPRRRTRWCSS
jgi:hypothetical protein